MSILTISGIKCFQLITALTDLLYSHGVNCHYLGHLAQLSLVEEEIDHQIEEKCRQGAEGKLALHTVPLCWLELLECEMVARASKNALDCYSTINTGVPAFQSALAKANKWKACFVDPPPEDDEMELLVLSEMDSEDSLCLLSCGEIPERTETEIGRCYRYTLMLYNNIKASKKENQALYTLHYYDGFARRMESDLPPKILP